MKKLNKVNYDITDGSSFAGFYLNVSVNKLLDILGDPTTIGSRDDKVQLQWVYYNPKVGSEQVITIYDYREDKPISKIKQWHIGAKNLNIAEIEHELKELGFFLDGDITSEHQEQAKKMPGYSNEQYKEMVN